jgi:outer membrane protein TolC
MQLMRLAHLQRLREQLTTIRYDLINALSTYKSADESLDCLRDAVETLEVVEKLIEEARHTLARPKEENHAIV